MPPPLHDEPNASGERSREDVRREFLAACGSDDGAPPDLDALVAPFPEPERSQFRAELEALQSHARQTKDNRSDATADFEPAGTFDYVPTSAPGAAAGATEAPDVTVDNAPPPPDGTVDDVAKVRKGRAVPLPASVAGYEILGVLGRGAMGVVYKARQRGLKRLVALKMILAGEHASATDLARFQAEANAVAQLQHPGIIQIFEVGEDEGRPFFSLEFVDGQSLHKKLQGNPQPAREAAALLQEMAEAMHYAHRHGIIHRDLKPANVLLTADGRPKIGDFGLAKRIDDEDESGLTKTGSVLGTPSYMSPEQAEGRLADVGPLSDVYSLGAILYDMLTGRPPFRGTSVLDTLEQLRTRDPVPPMQFQASVPRDLETICLKCLEKDRTRRYADAGALAADLGRFLRGEPILARPIGTVERLWRWSRRNKSKTAAIAGFLLVILVYAVSASLAAGWLKVERDAADQARAQAETNEQLANDQKRLAENREEQQRQTATMALDGLADFTDVVIDVFQDRRLSVGATPEVKKLRTAALANLSEKLDAIGKRLQKAATVSNADVVNSQLIGDRLKTLGLSKKARETFELGLKTARAQVERTPDSDKARANLAVMDQRLGDVAWELDGDARRAYDHYLEARRVHAQILSEPKSHDYTVEKLKRIVAVDDMHVGWALVGQGRSAAARPYFDAALQYRLQWAKDEPNKAEPRSWVMETRMWLGIVGWHVGDASAALEQADAAFAISQELLKQYPKYLDFFAEAAEVQGALGDTLLRLGKTAEAQRAYQESLTKLMVALKKNPDQIKHQPLLALTHERLGLAAKLLQQDNVAAEQFKRANQLRGELWDIDRDNLARKAAFVLSMARAGERATAMRLANDIRPKMAHSTELSLQVARSFAVLAADDKAGDRKNLTNALETLATATAQDYRDAAALESDPDLASLRSEPAFVALLARLRAR